jgi:DNA repair protein RadC
MSKYQHDRRIRESISGSLFETLYDILGYRDSVVDLLNKYPTVQKINAASENELCTIEGIGAMRARRLKAAFQLANHFAIAGEKTIAIHSPEDAADLVSPQMEDLEQEELWVLLLNTRNHIISVDKVYKGSLNSSQIRVGELFKCAIKANAAAVIIVHNHPSGDPSPSPDDIAITKAIVKAGKLLDTQVLDHLIIGQGKFISLNRRGLGFNGEDY